MSGANELTLTLLRSMPLPQPSADGDKEERGRVLVIAGSREVPGGALLAGVAALRAGAGKLQIAIAASIAPGLGVAIPEALVIALPELESGGIAVQAADILLRRTGRCDAVLIGPGMMDEDAVAGLTKELLNGMNAPTFVLDAGALPLMLTFRDALRAQAGRAVVTPHAGEMAALLDVSREEVVADPLAAARRCAFSLQCASP